MGIATIADNADVCGFVFVFLSIDSYLGFGATRGPYVLHHEKQKWWNRNHSLNMKDPNSTAINHSLRGHIEIDILISDQKSISEIHTEPHRACSVEQNQSLSTKSFYYCASIQVTTSISYEFLISTYVHVSFQQYFRSQNANGHAIDVRETKQLLSFYKTNTEHQLLPLAENRFSCIFLLRNGTGECLQWISGEIRVPKMSRRRRRTERVHIEAI